MKENLPLSYKETVESTTIEGLLTLYKAALDQHDFKEKESIREDTKLRHKSIWGGKRDTEKTRLLSFDKIREKKQRFCAQATFEQMGNDVKFELEMVPWMESADAPEVPGVSQSKKEKKFDEIYARLKLEELLSAIPGIGTQPDDILYAPHYDDLPKEEKLKKLEARYRDGKVSKEVYEEIKIWIESGN
jgi:hypothetical protein